MTSSSFATATKGMSPSSSTTLQEGDGVRKSGSIQMQLGFSKKCKPQSAYAVLSERALELHESEKAHRKKKGTRSIVDLSKCFNVSQQNCPKSKLPCVCLLMPDECFLFRAENPNETTEWYCTLLSAVISARALHLGRPVFASEFFESVWDITVCPQQPKLKRSLVPAANPEFANSPNICTKIRELAGRKRLCFYPHTIILCKVGIEPAHTGLPKSGIPPFRTVDFVEFSRHFIAQFGPVDKYFLMRIGRSSPMGSCEVWVQCESEDAAAEISRKLQEIIQRETEKKQQALQAIRGQQQQKHGGTASGSSVGPTSSSACCSNPHYSMAPTSCQSPCGSAPEFPSELDNPDGSSSAAVYMDQLLEPISEDEAIVTAAVGGGRKKQSSLSQSAKEKRLELRECKARVDSLEEEEQRFQQRQQQMIEASGGGGGWGSTPRRYIPMTKSMDHQVNGPARPICLQPGYQPFRRRGSSENSIPADVGSRSKSLSLEEQQARSLRPFPGARLWTMDKADSLLLLGYGPPETEETEDSGGTLRMIPMDSGSGSQVPSRSSSSLNLAPTPGKLKSNSSAGQLVETYVECHVPADDDGQNEEDQEENSSTSGSSTTEDEATIEMGKRRSRRRAAAAKVARRKPTAVPGGNGNKEMSTAQRRRQQQRAIGGEDGTGGTPQSGSLDAGTEADQSCSCSSSVASSSGVQHDDEEASTQIEDVGSIGKMPAEKFRPLLEQQPSSEYTLMDKVSCSSDSFSHLAIPQHGGGPIGGGGGFWCPEECSYTSDSGDSCYSSMANGQLNPRAFSFSSTSERAAPIPNFGGIGNKMAHPAAAKWTAAMGHRTHLFHQPPAHFSPPKSHAQSHYHHHGGQQQHQQESSSSSRFSMETSLITPLEEEERQVTFADNEEERRDRLGKVPTNNNNNNNNNEQDGDDLLRKRAFSLGSKSWITKPFRKLSSAHGTPSSSNGRHQRTSCGGASSRSGSSSLIGSMHADLCSVQEQSSQPHLPSSNSHNRLGSSSSFASSSAHGAGCIVGPIGHNRSDSIGSSHSAAISLPGFSQRRKKQPSEDQMKNEDLVELDFMPGGGNLMICSSSYSPFFAKNHSTQSVATTTLDSRSPLRGRTNSYDEHGVTTQGQQQTQQMAIGGGTPSKGGRGSAGALNNHQQPKQGGPINGGGGGGGGQPTAPGGWPKQRLRPSESFIRSIQQQQREIQQRNRQQQQQYQQQKQPRQQRKKADFPLQEVQCFIAPAERDKIDAMTARDTLSLRSQRSGSGSCSAQYQFETIEEQKTTEGGGGAGRPQSRRSLPSKPAMALHPHSPIQQSPLNEEEHQTGLNADDETTGGDGDKAADEQDYVLSEVKPPAGLKVTA